LSRDQESRRRFVHEARAASALDHPNIGYVHEIDESDGYFFIAMAYYEGHTLKEQMTNGPLPVAEAVKLAIQIANGLAKAHEKGIMHRDIKPANVLLPSDGPAKIVDFGLAKAGGQTKLTRTAMTMGTVAYMSPEQTRGIDVDHRTDIWSLGVVLYEMLTGEMPFKGDVEMAVLYSILHETPEFVTTLCADVPRDLEQIVEKALTKDPENRFQTMAEMLTELQTVEKKLESGDVKRGRPRLIKIGRKSLSLLYKTITAALLGLIFATAFYFWRSHGAEPGPVAIAILPLRSITDDISQEWFTDGMTDALITDLAKIGGLRVKPRSSVMRYKGTDKPMPEIAAELHVDFVVDGSVLKMGEQVQISARLVDAPKDQYVWAEKYEREFRNVLTLQGEIAQTIARHVQVQLTPEEETRLTSVGPVDPETYELYLKGRHHANRGSMEDIKNAVEYYNRALERDANFGKAYTGLVESYLLEGFRSIAPKDAVQKFREYAQKAIELDDALGTDHHMLAMIKIFSDWDWAGAEAELLRAIELDPNSSAIYDSYCQFLWAMGRMDESVAAGERAVKLDPLDHFASCDLAWAYYFDKQVDRAVEQVQKTIELFGPDCPHHNELSIKLRIVQTNRRAEIYPEIIAELQNRRTAGQEHVLMLALLGYLYALAEQQEQAQEVIRELHELQTEEFVDPTFLVPIYSALGDRDEALILLEQAYEQRSFLLLYTIKVDPRFDPLREDPRFQDLLSRMKLADIQI
jgi:TolB-like protein/Tfp pilus assembly protein PilF